MSRWRPVDAARLLLGLSALVHPQALLRPAGSGDEAGVRTVTRVLGARYVVQSAVGLVLPTRRVARIDAAVDLAHAASMVGAAQVFPRHRRLALSSGALALAFAAADLTEPGS
jgi:hypothetical protein